MNAIVQSAGSSNARRGFGAVSAIARMVFVVTVKPSFMIVIVRRNAITLNAMFGWMLNTYEGQVRHLWL